LTTAAPPPRLEGADHASVTYAHAASTPRCDEAVTIDAWTGHPGFLDVTRRRPSPRGRRRPRDCLHRPRVPPPPHATSRCHSPPPSTLSCTNPNHSRLMSRREYNSLHPLQFFGFSGSSTSLAVASPPFFFRMKRRVGVLV